MTVKIDSIEDARKVGAEHDVVFPSGQGRPPYQKLARTLVKKGIDVEWTDFFPESLLAKAQWTKGGTSKGEVSYKVTAVAPNKSGKGKHPVKRVLTLADVRQAVACSDRGRVSAEKVLEAAAKLAEWGNPSELSKVKVERVDA